MYPFPNSGARYFINFIAALGCNFDCPECFWSGRPRKPTEIEPAPEMDPYLLRDCFSLFKPSIIMFNGGEPLTIPGLPAIWRELSKDHLLGLNTNTSRPQVIRELCEGIPADRWCFVISSLHAEELDRRGAREDYLQSLRLLKAHGVPVMVVWVLRPGHVQETLRQNYLEPIQEIGYPVCARRYITQDPQMYADATHPDVQLLRAWGVDTYLFNPYVMGPIPENGFKEVWCRAGESILDIFRKTGKILPCVYATKAPLGYLWSKDFHPQEGRRRCTFRGGCVCATYLSLDVTEDTQNLPHFLDLVQPNLCV